MQYVTFCQSRLTAHTTSKLRNICITNNESSIFFSLVKRKVFIRQIYMKWCMRIYTIVKTVDVICNPTSR